MKNQQTIRERDILRKPMRTMEDGFAVEHEKGVIEGILLTVSMPQNILDSQKAKRVEVDWEPKS